MSSSALTLVPIDAPINVQRVRAQREAVKLLIKDVLIEGIDNDYAVIPGTKKLTLLKPGAEKICSLFGFAVEPSVEAIRDGEDTTFRVIVRLSSGGVFLGEGVGEASTLESKFAWREAVCQEEWDEADPHKRRKHWKKGWNGASPVSVQQVRENPADKASNMLKIAKKRAMIDAVLTVTAASDVFTQDLENKIDGNRGRSTAPVSGRQVEEARSRVELIDPMTEGKAFYKAWKSPQGQNDEKKVKEYMKIHCGGITDDRKMEKKYYAEALRWAGTKEPIPEVKKAAPAPAAAKPAATSAPTQAEPPVVEDSVINNIQAAFHILDYDLAQQAALYGEYAGRLPELATELSARVEADLAESGERQAYFGGMGRRIQRAAMRAESRVSDRN